jgi:predicted nucleic acid-binding protein
VTLVVDASVALKWVLEEPDSNLAQSLAEGEEALLVPDFWLNEATNVCWLQVRKRKWSADEAREGLALLRALVQPTATGDLDLHDIALDIGLTINHSTYDTLYVAFAVAMGARGVVVADGPFMRDMSLHPDPTLAGLLIPLSDWGQGRGHTRPTSASWTRRDTS